MAETALVIIARAPDPQRVKTRLAAGIGHVAALAVYRQLLHHVVQVRRAWHGPVLLAATGNGLAWTGLGLAELPRRAQPDGDLGDRIAAALHWGLSCADHAIAIGTDCPGLQRGHLDTLAALLRDVDVAWGPATDGGYWGVGVAGPRPIPVITGADLPWSTPQLLTVSRACVAGAGLTDALGSSLADCDDAADLAAAVAAGLLTWPLPHEHLP